MGRLELYCRSKSKLTKLSGGDVDIRNYLDEGIGDFYAVRVQAYDGVRSWMRCLAKGCWEVHGADGRTQGSLRL